jgi:hypothetical protein
VFIGISTASIAHKSDGIRLAAVLRAVVYLPRPSPARRYEFQIKNQQKFDFSRPNFAENEITDERRTEF